MNPTSPENLPPQCRSLLETLRLSARSLPDGCTVTVGLSGGLDSVVLLHMLACLREELGLNVHALHVHHGLSRNADDWLGFCTRLCQEWNVPFRSVKVEVKKDGLGIEAAARKARYQAFSDDPSGIIALAHHQDDQIETFMLAAVRGGGIKALAAMPQWRKLDEGTQIWRPLLTFSRKELESYAAACNLPNIEDESNADTAFLRNWMRYEALPVWRERIPNFDRHVCANIRSLQTDLAILDEVVEADYQTVCQSGRFQVSRWQTFSEARRSRILWRFFKENGIVESSPRKLADFARILLEAETAQWQFGETSVCLYRDFLFILKQNQFADVDWIKGKEVRGRLKDILQENGFFLVPHRNGLPESVLEEEGIIRTVGSDDMMNVGFLYKNVKKVLQENHIVPFVRKCWPIITNTDGNCIAIVNLTVSHDFQGIDGFLPVYGKFLRYKWN